MSVLAFKVNADWEEVQRLRDQIQALKTELKGLNVNNSPDVAKNIEEQLSVCVKRYEELIKSASKASVEINNSFKGMTDSIDLSNPTKELEKFDAQVVKMCQNLDGYFEGLKGNLQDMVSVLGNGSNVADNIKINDANIAQVEELKRQQEELIGQIQQKNKELEETQRLYRQLADAVKTNNASAANLFVPSTDKQDVEGKLNRIKGEIEEYEKIFKQIDDTISQSEKRIPHIEEKIRRMREQFSKTGESAFQNEIERLEKSLEAEKKKIETAKSDKSIAVGEQITLVEKMYEYQEQLDSANEKHVKMRTEIMNSREQMARLIQAGMQGTPMFQKVAIEAGNLRKQMALTNAYMEYFADPNRHLTTLKVGLQGVAGAAGLLTGAIGLFNDENKEMVKIQTKVQSILAIVVGLETTYNLVKKTSNVMLAIEEVKTWLLAKARGVQTAATIAATRAQEGLNAAMAKNPIGAIITLLVLAGSAIWAIVKALTSETEAEKKAKEAAKKRREEQVRAEQEFAKSVADSAATQLAAYYKLKKGWEELSGSLEERRKYITKTKEETQNLGYAINSVSDAERFYVTQTDNVVQAIIARAKANAYAKVIEDKISEQINRKIKFERDKSVASGGSYVTAKGLKWGGKNRFLVDSKGSVGNATVTIDELRRIGRKDKEGAQIVLSDKEIKQLNKNREQDARIRRKLNEEIINRAGKGTEEIVKKLTEEQIEEEKVAKELTKDIKPYTPSNKNSGGTGGDKDDLQERTYEQQELIKKYAKEMQELEEELQQQITDARLELLEDSSRKTLLQIEENKKKELDAIDKEIGELIEKKREQEKNLYLKGGKDRKEYNDPYRNKTDEQVLADIYQENPQLAKLYEQRRKYAEESAEKQRKNVAKQDAQYMTDYLKEYGSFQEKKLAIEKSYADKIKAARESGNEWEAASLQQQMDAELKQLNTEDFKNSIDWDGVFGDLGSLSESYLATLKGKLKDYLDTGDLDVENIKIIQEKIHEIDDLLVEQRSSLFNFVNPEYEKQKRLIEEAKEAQLRLNKAIKEQQEAQEGVDYATQNIMDMAADYGISLTPDDVKHGSAENLIEELGFDKTSEEAENLRKAFVSLQIALSKLGVKTDIATKAEVDKERAESKAAKNTWKEKADEKAASIIGVNKWVQEYLGDLPDLFDSIGLGEIGEKIGKGLTGFNDAAGAAADFMTGNYIGALTKGISAIKNFGSMLGIGGGNAEEVNKLTEELTDSNDRLRKSVDKLKESMDKNSGVKAISDYEKAYAAQERINEQQRKILIAQNRYNAAHHSNAVYFRDEFDSTKRGKDAYRQINQLLGTNISNLAGLEALNPEQMDKIRTYLTDVWKTITTEVGEYDKSEYWENFADQAGELEKLTDAINENLTQISFDSLKDSFISSLMDMNKSAQDFAKDFEEYIMKALLNSFIGNEMQENMEQWYKKWANAMKEQGGSLTKAQISAFRTEYDEFVKEGLKIRDNLSQLTGYGSDYRSQEATHNAIQGVSEDKAEELVGRLTAIQIAGEQRNDMLRERKEDITLLNATTGNIHAVTIDIRDTSNEALDILAEQLLVQKEIRDNTASMMKPIKLISENLEIVMNDVKDLK